MKKEFVPYQLALRMKRIGFDEPCLGGYYMHSEKFSILDNNKGYSNGLSTSGLADKSKVVLAPTYSQAFRWFRETYGLHHVIHQLNFKKGTDEEYLAEVDKKDGFSYFRTYEECEYYCLEKLIEVVEEKQK